MFVGTQTFNPGQIVARILVLQAAFYTSLALILAILVTPYSRAGLTLDHIFNHRTLQLNSFTDALIVFAYLINSLVVSVLLRFVVARAKKCLDYGSTIYLLHLAACWLLRAFPTNPTWWAIVALCGAISILLAETLCVRYEMMDIPMGGIGKSKRADAVQPSSLEMV